MALDLGDNYYDPYQDTQQQSISLKETLFNTAKSMALMIGLNMVGQAAWSRISAAGAKTIARYGTGRLGAIASTTGATSIGGILQNTGAGKVLRQSFMSGTKIFRDSLKTRAGLIAQAAEQGPMHAAVKTATSVFRDKTTFAAVAARTAYKTGVIGAGVAYAIDLGLGYGESSYGLERKAWYDIPGKVSNFGKWMAISTVSGMGFHAAQKGLSAVGAAGGLQVAKVFKGPIGKGITNFIHSVRQGFPKGFGTNNEASETFRHEVLNWSANFKKSLTGRVVNRAMNLTGNVASITTVSNNAIIDTISAIKNKFSKSTSSSLEKKQSIGDPIRDALKQIKDIWVRNRQNYEEYHHAAHPGLAAVELVNNFTNKVGGAVQADAKGFIDSFAELSKINKKKTFLDEIFGLEPLRIKDVIAPKWEQEKRSILKDKLVGDQGAILMDHVLNMRVSPGHYKAHGSEIKGGGVNLGIFDPLASMKRATSALLLQPIRFPLLKFNINIGDMFGVSTWASDAPAVTFWADRRSYKLGPSAAAQAEGMKNIFPRGRGTVSTAEVSPDIWQTAYVNGKLSFFTEAGEIQTLDWGRKLMFDYQQGARRGNENAWMKNAAQTRDQVVQPKSPVSNKWLYTWLEESELTFPGFFQGTLNRLNARLKGKNTEYKSLAHVLSTSQNVQDFEKYRNVFAALRMQSGQEVYHALSKKGALDTIADVMHTSQFGDLYETLLSSRTLQARIRDSQLDPDFISKRGLLEDIAHLKAFPGKGRHVTVRGVGLSKELSLEDQVRLEIVDDFFGKIWKGRGQGGDHPLTLAAPELLKRGYINEKQAQALRAFATVSPFVNTGILAKTSNINEPKFMDILKEARRSLEGTNHNIHKDILDYVSSRTLRNPTIKDVGFESVVHAPTYGHLNNASPYVSVSTEPFGFFMDTAGGIAKSVTDMMSHLVIPFKKNPDKHFGLGGSLKYLTSSLIKVGIAQFAFRALDASLAANPLLDDTALEAGVTGAVAEVAAQGRLVSSKVFDAMGLTGVAKHLNGLMPGFTTSVPGGIIGAVVSRTVGGGVASMAKGFAYGAIGNRILSPLLPDWTKTNEQLKDEYSGRVKVPIMKSPFWLLGPTPWQGQKVEGYSPNWYIRTKSRWQETDTLYGSTIQRIIHEPIFPMGISLGDFIDPYFMERKHYFSRPYPATGRFGEEIPLIGPLVAGTVGQLIKPPKTMHQEFLSGGDDSGAADTYPFSNPPPTLQEGLGMMQHSWGLNTMRGRSSLFGTFRYSPARPHSYAMGEEFLYNVQNFAGLKGFVAGAVSERLFPTSVVLPTFETAGRIASQSRFYGDANLGGLGIFTEPVRRLIQKRDSRKFGINPIPNMMPDWLPQEFLAGDPYARIIRGELRLPGRAYESTHAGINRAMPARASMVGGSLEHVVQYFTGLLPPALKELYDITEAGTTVHRQVQDQLAAEGLLIQAEKLVYDVKRDISGHVDAIIRDGIGGRGRKALEIKTINDAAFGKLEGPKNQHVGQLNFYLKKLGMQSGEIMYINRENPSQIKMYQIKYSESRYQRDIEKLDKARQIAVDVMSDGVGDKYGYTYSWLDRLDILSDVAPYSDEFKEAKWIVEQQIRANLLTQDEVGKYKNALKQKQARIRKYELYPYRFKGRVFSPDTEKNIQSINEDIKAAADYSLPERLIGAAWETFTNSNNFITSKFFAFKDPLEHYKQIKLYGKEYTPWDDPWGSFADPAMRNMLSRETPIGGGYKAGIIGYMMGGGPVGAVIGGALGTAYGAVNGLVRTATDSVYIPGAIQEQRQMNRYFDAAKFERYSRAAQLSEGLTKKDYQDAANATLNAYNQVESTVGNLFKATPYFEKPYIAAWLEESDPKRRKEILKYLPADLSKALKRTWESEDSKSSTSEYVARTSKEIAQGYNGPGFDRSILDPSVMLEDIKLKTLNEAGLDAHDYGLGWSDQQARLQENYNNIAYVKPGEIERFGESTPMNLSPSHVRYAIIEFLRNKGVFGRANVYINGGADDINTVTVTIKRDRARAVTDALNNRRKYIG